MADNILSMALSLFFVINVLGNLPLYISLLARYSPKKQRLILIREFFLAFIILLLFNFFGSNIFKLLGISHHIIGIAGGILLLLIAITMIFPQPQKEQLPQHEPIVVPLATPVIAGPGAIASVMLFSSKLGNHLLMTFIICSTMILSFLLALVATSVKKGLGEKGLIALERFGGLILSLISIQMFTTGIVDLIKDRFHLF